MFIKWPDCVNGAIHENRKVNLIRSGYLPSQRFQKNFIDNSSILSSNAPINVKPAGGRGGGGRAWGEDLIVFVGLG